MRYH
jgi:hypothetical protein